MKPFDIQDYLDQLTPDGGKNTRAESSYKCPVCGADNFKVNHKTGAYNGWNCDCKPAEVREVLSPLQWTKPAREDTEEPVKYPYQDKSGRTVFHACRQVRDGKKRNWKEPKDFDNSQLIPYNWLNVVPKLKEGELCFIVEGETCVEALKAIGLNAITFEGGTASHHWEACLKGLKVYAQSFIVCPDRDIPGVEFMAKIADAVGIERWLYAFPDSKIWDRLPSHGGADVVDWINDYQLAAEQIMPSVASRRLQNERKDTPALSRADELKKSVEGYVSAPDPFSRELLSVEIRNEFKIGQAALARLENTAKTVEVEELEDMDSIAVSSLQYLEDLCDGKIDAGLFSGFYDLDNLTNGFHRGDLIVVAGRPSQGKTAFVMNCARNIAGGQGKRCLIFSLEMSKQQLLNRIWSAESGIELSRFRSGKIRMDEWEKLHSVVQDVAGLPISINDTAGLGVEDIAQACRRRVEAEDVGMVVIDYLQIMGGIGQSIVQDLGRITRTLKTLARDLNVPVVLLSQLSRGVESRNDKRPLMSDLRDSGTIEQDADIVLMLYRDEYYNPETEHRGVAEVLIRKHRNGPIGTAKLLFESEYTRFRNLAH